MSMIDRRQLRTILASSGVTVAILAALLLLVVASDGSAQSCTNFVVTGTGTNWTDISTLWTPSGSYPGRDTNCDTASDTSSTATTIAINTAITYPIAGLDLSCNGCVIDIQTGGSLTLAGPGTIGSGSTLRVSGGTLTIASGGTLTFQSGSQFEFSAGTVNIQTGGTMDFPTGSSGLTTGGVLGGDGTLSITGGTLNIGAVTEPGAFTMTAGTLDGNGFLNVRNTMTWHGGTLTGSGGTQLAGGGTGTFDGTTGDMKLDGRSFNDYGFIHYSATSPGALLPSGQLYLANGAQFTVYGMFDFEDDGAIENGGIGASAFLVKPNGLAEKVGGTGVSTIFPISANDATVYIFSGTLEFKGDGTHNGNFAILPNATLQFSATNTTINGSIGGFFGGAGTVDFSAGTTNLTNSSFYSLDGTTTIDGGNVTFNAGGFGHSGLADTTDFDFSRGTLTLGGLSIYGFGTWSGGTIAASCGCKQLFIDVDATLSINPALGPATIDAAEILNNGTINYIALNSGSLDLANSADIDNHGTFDIKSDRPITTSSGGGGLSKKTPVAVKQTRRLKARTSTLGPAVPTIFNNGTFKKSQGTLTSIYPDLANKATVLALSGTMSFTGTSVYTQTVSSSVTTLGPGDISVASPLLLKAGKLDGAGTLSGSLDNSPVSGDSGKVSPGGASSVGTITVTGNYSEGANGASLDIDIASATSYDVLAVDGTFTPIGTLNVALLGGYPPANGAMFDVVTYGSYGGGDFTTKMLPTWASGHGSMVTSTNPPNAYRLTAVVTPSSADVHVVMGGPAAVNVGDPLSYTIDISNLGPDPTSGTFSVDDTLPTGVTGVSFSGSGWNCTGPTAGHMNCNTTSPLASGASLPTLTLSMTAPASGGSVTNSATVTNPTTPDPNTPNTASVTTLVYKVSITKIGPASAASGQNFNYTVTVTNNGPSDVNGVTVNDTATSTPSGNVNFVSNSGGCATTYPCSLGTINTGASVQIISTYSTTPAFNGVVNNIATVTLSPASAPKSASASTTIGPQADLSITKTGPATAVTPGQTFSYTIVVNNAGPQSAVNTVVTDQTPAGIAFVSATGGGPGCTAFPCTLGTMTSGQTVTITSTYLVPPSYSGGPILNTAAVSSDISDPQPGNNSASTSTNVGVSADVSISKTGPATVGLGQNITYTINVSNFGPSTASGVSVSDITPAGLTFVSATPSQGTCSGTTTVTCPLGSLAIGPPATIAITYNVPASYANPSISNKADVTSGNDPVPANNSSTATTTISAQADVSITKSGPPSAVAGQNISYTITVSNAGPLGAANTFVNDVTPAGLTFISNSGACSSPYPCALGTLAAGQSVVITTTYNIPANYAGTSITNTATVSTSSPESNTSNNSAVATTPMSATGVADLSVAKTGPGTAHPNDVIDFTVTVANNGPATATNVVITDPTPAGLQFLSNSGGCSTPYPCVVASIASSNLIGITSRYRVAAQSGTITNTASATSSQTDPTPGNNSSSSSISLSAGLACPQPPPLTAPANGATVASPITLSWNGVPNASNYTVVISNGSTSQSFSTTAGSITIALGNGAYSWTVTANGGPSCTPATSAPFNFTICNNPGVPVPSVVAVSTTGQTYTVEWTPTEGTTSYELQESLDAAFSGPTSTTQAGTSKSFTKNVTGATTFYYRVRAVGGCSQGPGPFSETAPVVVIPIPALGTIGPNVVVPAGSTQPVTFSIQVPGLPGVSAAFIATVDKPWLAVAPTSGIMPPEGITFSISADPSSLQNGTWTGTVIIIFGSTVAGKQGLDVAPKTSIPVSISLTTPVSPGTLSSPSATAVVIPSVGHLAGFSSQWQSDIRIANITALSKKVQLTFSAGSATSQSVKQTTLSIDPGATTALDDIVRNWFGVGTMGESSNGVLTVQPLDAAGKPDLSVTKATVATSRTYNSSVAGTLGQFIPAVPLANFISKLPGAASIVALQQIAQSDSFRTNLGLVEATGKPASVLVSVFNGGGSKILDIPVTLAAGEQKQLNSFLADKGVTLTNGHIEVLATAGDGKVTAYASVIDSRSTDPLLVSGVPLGGPGAARFVIPGVASLDTGATWRSDVRVFNSSTSPQTATLTLYPTGNPSASVSQAVTVQPGEVKALDDIVHSTFNLTNAGGALHVTTAVATPFIVTARTFNDTPAGTLGQFQQAVTPADAVGSGERSLQLLQMEDSPRYRTNLGLAEVTGKSVTAEVTVVLPDSKVAPRVNIPLGAFEYRQFAIISSLGLGNTYNARISVRVIDGQGKVTAYGSVIDQKTQAPTFVPAQ